MKGGKETSHTLAPGSFSVVLDLEYVNSCNPILESGVLKYLTGKLVASQRAALSCHATK